MLDRCYRHRCCCWPLNKLNFIISRSHAVDCGIALNSWHDIRLPHLISLSISCSCAVLFSALSLADLFAFYRAWNTTRDDHELNRDMRWLKLSTQHCRVDSREIKRISSTLKSRNCFQFALIINLFISTSWLVLYVAAASRKNSISWSCASLLINFHFFLL
jgi:hypothetical protein